MRGKDGKNILKGIKSLFLKMCGPVKYPWKLIYNNKNQAVLKL